MTTPLPVRYLLDEFKDTTTEEVARLYAEVVDRWTWDTGSAEDQRLMQRIGTEHRWRVDMNRPKKQPDSIEAAIAADISEEIDREILRDLINMSDDEKES